MSLKVRCLAAVLAVALSACFPPLSTVAPPPTPGVAMTSIMGDSVLVVNRREVTTFFMHQGIWWDMVWCLGLNDAQGPESIRWSVADSLKTPEGLLAYGMASVNDAGIAEEIIIDWEYYFVPAVISHEIIHVLMGPAANHRPGQPNYPADLFGACVLPMPFDLPARPWRE